jgi:methylamine dehydrogenase accessory protein MauD
MTEFWGISIGLIAAVQLISIALLFAFARELGVLFVRLGPIGALPGRQGPSVGATIPMREVVDIFGNTHEIGASGRESLLLVFISTSCSACEQILPGLATLSTNYRGIIRCVALSSTDRTPDDLAFAKKLVKAGVTYVCDAEAWKLELQIGATPYAVLTDENGRVKSKGVVNNLEHLESLMFIETFQVDAAGSSDASTAHEDASDLVSSVVTGTFDR